MPLEAFINAVVDHVALQATQDERARYWMREAHAHWGVDADRSHAAPFLTRPPADTLVLLAPAKSPDHLEWIRTQRLYNVRAGKRRGSVGLDSRELAAEFVLVYEARTENVELWAATGDPMLVTQEQLLQMGYPDPTGDLYYCLELEPMAGVSPAIEITLDRVRKMRRQAPGKVRAHLSRQRGSLWLSERGTSASTPSFNPSSTSPSPTRCDAHTPRMCRSNQKRGRVHAARRKRNMVQMTIEVPEEALSALRKDPAGFAREMRLAAAVKWYEMRLVSQGRAAEIAGLSRSAFIDALGRFGVTPFQYEAHEAIEEAGRG